MVQLKGNAIFMGHVCENLEELHKNYRVETVS